MEVREANTGAVGGERANKCRAPNVEVQTLG